MPNNEFQVLIQAIVDAKDVQTRLNAIKDLSVKIEKVNLDQSAINSLRNQLTKNGIDVNLVLGNTNKINSQAKQAGQQIGNTINTAIKSTLRPLSVDNATAITQIAQLTARFQKLGFTEDEISQKMSSVTTSYRDLQSAISGGSNSAVISANEKFNQSLTETKNLYRRIAADSSAYYNATKQAKLSNNIQNWMSKNTAATKQAKASLQDFLGELNNGRVNVSRLNEIQTKFQQIDTQMRTIGRLGKSFTQVFTEGMKKFSYWTSSTFIVMKTIQEVKQAITNVKDLDTALVDLKKTTSMSASQLEDFYYQSNEVAKQMGVSTKEILDQASAWSRLGYQTSESATKMAKLSSQFASISPDMDVNAATNGLVSIMKAFNISEDNVLDDIMSKINEIGNTAATSNGEIVNMLKKSSSAMAEANNTLEETIALETAAVEIVRDDDSVGTAYKTVSMRLRGYDEEVEAYTKDVQELSGEIADLTKTASTPGGISLFTDESKTEYKSTYQLLKEISQIYDQLNDKTQAKLLETIAGKRQGQIIAATLNNFKAAEKAMNDMANSAGSADDEMSIIMDSLDYKLNRLSQTGVGISQNLFERDDMKSIVDALTKIGEALDFVTDKAGLLGSIGLGAGLFAGIKNAGRTSMFSYLNCPLL